MASEAAVLEMEKKAAMRKRMNKAQAEFNANNTVHAQNMAREQAENNVMREAASSAHERFMQRRREFIQRHKFAVSPFEFAATMGYKRGEQNPADLRAHELKMVDKKNEGAIGVAAKNAEGMANQGVNAARINAGVKEKEIEAGLTKHEREMQNRKDITIIQADAQKSIAEGQNNTTLKNSELQGKTQKEIATLQGKTQESIAGKQADATVSAAGITAKSAAESRLADAEARRAERERAAYEGYMGRVISSHGGSLPKEWEELTPAERFAKWKQMMGRENSSDSGGGGPKKGDRRQVKGGFAVYDGNKWVMEK